MDHPKQELADPGGAMAFFAGEVVLLLLALVGGIWALAAGYTGPVLVIGFVLLLLCAVFVFPAWAVFGLGQGAHHEHED